VNALESLTIRAFRGLRDVELERLGRINLLVGANNSGKTSVLEAIATFSRPLDPLEWATTAWRREVGSARGARLESLKWMFPQPAGGSEGSDAHVFRTEISGTGRFPVRTSRGVLEENEGTPARSPYWKAIGLTEDTETAPQRGLLLTLTAEGGHTQAGLFDEHEPTTFQFWEDVPIARGRERKQPALPTGTITPFSHRIERLQVQQLSEASFGDFKPAVIDLVRRVDDGIRDLVILAPSGSRPSLYLRHAVQGLVPLSAFGDGVRRVLMYALTLPPLRGGVLLIDELETAIHVSALGGVFGWLVEACREYDVQLFATTHSLEALDAVLTAGEAHREQIAGYHLGAVGRPGAVKRYGGELLYRLRHERGLDVR
jgi:hypothetical protein